MKRHFPDFISAYFDYARDGFCPDSFHTWTALSIISGALERKVRLFRSEKAIYYPNIYVLLVGYPGRGKSTALNAGVSLLEDIRAEINPRFNILPNQVTEPKLLELLQENANQFMIGTNLVTQCAGYYYAPEASSSLKNLFGDFIATVTDLYDCPKIWRKQIKAVKEPIILRNVCFNLFGASTFDYLRTLVTEESVMGGFASRLIYVIEKEKKLRDASWHPKKTSHNPQIREKLSEDLMQIHQLIGEMQVTDEFMRTYEEWFAGYDRELLDVKSERLQSLIARKHTNLIKLALLFSVSESNDLLMEKRHFDRALFEIEKVMENVSEVIISAATANKMGESGVTQLVMRAIGREGDSAESHHVRQAVISAGHDHTKFGTLIDSLCAAKAIEMRLEGGRTIYKLLVDPDSYL